MATVLASSVIVSSQQSFGINSFRYANELRDSFNLANGAGGRGRFSFSFDAHRSTISSSLDQRHSTPDRCSVHTPCNHILLRGSQLDARKPSRRVSCTTGECIPDLRAKTTGPSSSSSLISCALDAQSAFHLADLVTGQDEIKCQRKVSLGTLLSFFFSFLISNFESNLQAFIS
ncbi:unnamed protein product [Protopolystoma xenopodis]|uniref:Uncharacterized protein n=1 Tax=Protopolystoma xenopodis TaxID=117903 RepID=A0A3S5A1F7_9PLAT|nr:unnamed protein product [Protopolystoma xenopodis]